MSTIVKERNNIFKAFINLFNSDIGEGYEEVKLPPELNKALESLSVKEKIIEKAINAINTNSSKKGGFGKKINPIKSANTEKAMREMLQKDKDQKDGMEIGD